MKNMEEWEALKKNAHETYNGGHNEEATNHAFHHGMNTGFNVAEKFITQALAQREREIEKLLYTEGGFLREDENVASDILSKLQETEKKDIDARWG